MLATETCSMVVSVLWVVHATNDVLLQRVIRPRDLDATIAGFTSLGFPNCGGAIDRTHIPNRVPKHQAAQFINRKAYCSVVLQVLVDHQSQFQDIYVGWSGKQGWS
nr:protein ALP1-like [Pelodiscus sinensis]|eukprot:XP_025045735.1 protein ALP1-like [Pelodiscus sinensis]